MYDSFAQRLFWMLTPALRQVQVKTLISQIQKEKICALRGQCPAKVKRGVAH